MPGSPSWQELSVYLDRAFSLPEEERSTWLAALCSNNPEVGQALRSLLDQHQRLHAEKFLDDGQTAGLSEAAYVGQKIGPYKLLSKIGQGGMGSVWLAERSDGEIELRVAIKFVGAEFQESVWHDRFLAERRLLASLNHPSIVHPIDAGRTDTGKPYLVMEYVEGVPIDVYCAKIPVRARLELFLQVCAGAAHAHRKLIIHRDLKPSNILVDASGHPKLLDFGIAKLLDETGDATQTAERLLTPHYASPEQMRGEPQGTATDVYSLGAVLYKVLTSRSPHQSATGTADAIAVMMGKHTIQPARSLDTTLPPDLDYILAKAMRAEPEERYSSVDAFAKDIQALLDSRPVEARSGNNWYRAKKFLGRHAVPVTAGALLVVGLAGGLYLVNRERAIAQQHFQEVRELAHTFVFDLHDEAAKLEGSTKMRELMVRTGLKYLDSLSANAENDLDLQKEIAAGYLKIAEAQGFPTRPNLGRIDDARASMQNAGRLYKAIAAKNSSYLPDLAKYYLQYAGLARFTHDLKLARTLSESGIHTLEQVRAAGHFDEKLKVNYLGAWCTLGDMDEDMGQYRLAWSEFSRCGELARDLRKAGKNRMAPYFVAQADERIATAAQELGLLPQALQALDEDQVIIDRMLVDEPHNPKLHRFRALIDHYRSEIYFAEGSANLGNPGMALQSAKQYLARTEEMVRSDPNNASAKLSRAIATLQISFCLRESDAHAALEKAREALHLFDDLIASGDKSYLVTSRRVSALIHVAAAHLKANQITDALQASESALAATQALTSKETPESHEHVMLFSALTLAGNANALAHNFERAETLFRGAREQAQSMAKGQELEDLVPMADAEAGLGKFYASRRQLPEARDCFEKLNALWNRFAEPNVYVDKRKAEARELLASIAK